MFWDNPPKIKIYEAIGAIADGRIEMTSENEAKVFSSSRKKYYNVIFDSKENAIFSNDNGSYWRGYLGYPSITFLIAKNILKVNTEVIEMLKDYKWKDINQKFKNDFTKTEEFIRESILEKGFDLKKMDDSIEAIQKELEDLKLKKLNYNLKPPKGY